METFFAILFLVLGAGIGWLLYSIKHWLNEGNVLVKEMLLVLSACNLAHKLNSLILNGEGNGDEATELRDKLDEIYNHEHLGEDGRQALREFAELIKGADKITERR